MAKKKRKIADTSIEAYHLITDRGQTESERVLVLRIITEAGKPMTNRQITIASKLERGNVCRVVKNLEQAGIFNISHKEKCPITGMRVRWYQLVETHPAA